MTNPEDGVLDAIDALVEGQLNNYPNRSGYDFDVHQPRCVLCGREFHGLRRGACPGEFATPEEIDWGRRPRRRGINRVVVEHDEVMRYPYFPQRYVIGDGAMDPIPEEPAWLTEAAEDYAQECVLGVVEGGPWLLPEQMNPDQSGSAYTLEAIRGGFVGPSYQEWFGRVPRVRFWTTDPETNRTIMLEGTLVIGEYTQTPDSVTVGAELALPVTRWQFDNEQLATEAMPIDLADAIEDEISVVIEDDIPRPVGVIPDGRVSIEVGAPAGFQPLGTISGDDLEIVHDTDYEVREFGGRTVRTSERYGVTINFDPETGHRLLGGR